MIPDKCQNCGAAVAEQLHRGAAVYKCATRYFPKRGRIIAQWQQSASCGLAQRDQLAAELERLKAENAALRERVKRLEDAGDAMATEVVLSTANAWRKAKEANP